MRQSTVAFRSSTASLLAALQRDRYGGQLSSSQNEPRKRLFLRDDSQSFGRMQTSALAQGPIRADDLSCVGPKMVLAY